MPSVRRLTAILAADVAGYSRLMGASTNVISGKRDDRVARSRADAGGLVVDVVDDVVLGAGNAEKVAS